VGILDDKAVLITGGASGIGRASALEAHAEGARVLVSDVNAEGAGAVAKQITDEGGTAVAVPCDVTDEEQVAALVDRCASELGGLDGAFNCAGILDALGSVADTETKAWQRVIDVDLTGVFMCTKHELRHMAANGGGSIVNMASAAGLIGWPGASAYVAAKHGVVGLTKSAALEFAPAGIRVNSMCPSYVITPMVERDLFAEALGNDQEAIDAAKANHPIGRFGQPNEIACAVTWRSRTRPRS